MTFSGKVAIVTDGNSGGKSIVEYTEKSCEALVVGQLGEVIEKDIV